MKGFLADSLSKRFIYSSIRLFSVKVSTIEANLLGERELDS